MSTNFSLHSVIKKKSVPLIDTIFVPKKEEHFFKITSTLKSLVILVIWLALNGAIYSRIAPVKHLIPSHWECFAWIQQQWSLAYIRPSIHKTSDRFCYKFFKIAYHCCMCIVNSNLNLLDINPTFNCSNENTNLSLRTWSSKVMVLRGKSLLLKFHMWSQRATVVSSGL